MTTLDERWGYSLCGSEWMMAIGPGRGEAIDEALNDLVITGDVEPGEVIEVHLCRCRTRCLSEYVDGSALLEQLDDHQWDEGGDDYGSAVPETWDDETWRRAVRTLTEEVGLVVARWCDHHGVRVPWWTPEATEVAHVLVYVECDGEGSSTNWREVAP